MQLKICNISVNVSTWAMFVVAIIPRSGSSGKYGGGCCVCKSHTKFPEPPHAVLYDFWVYS